MIVYNLSIKAEHSIAADYISWLKNIHIPELMATGLFVEYKIFRLLEQDDAEGVTFVVQYFANSMEDYQEYITRHAPAMREKTFKLFGNKYIAFRTVMETEA